VESGAFGVQALDPLVQRFGGDPLRQCLGPVDVRQVGGDRAGLGVGVEAVDEPGLDAGAEIEERQRVDRRVESVGEPGGVLPSLELDVSEPVPGGLGLQRPDGLAVDEQEVVGEAVALSHLELAHRDARRDGEVHGVPVLNGPAGGLEGRIDVLAGFAFRGGAHSGFMDLLQPPTDSYAFTSQGFVVSRSA
jgi:hypothetical protein